jgi:hypothetical protein
MGFRVEIGDDKSRLLRNLRLTPSEVFAKPYGGYVLFLVGGADREALEWLAENVVALDSLTGEHIAFAIFARSLRMRLHVDYSYVPPELRRRNTSFAVPLDEIKTAGSVTRLVESHRLGWVLDGDEINAITYAVDEIARSFGVVDELPCALILDAIPKREFTIFHLTSSNLDSLVALLRRAIQNLLETPGYGRFMPTIRRVIRLQRESVSLQSQINSLNRRLGSISHEPSVVAARDLIPEFRNALLAGNMRRFLSLCRKHAIKSVIPQDQLDGAIVIAREHIEKLLTYNQTAHRLYLYATQYDWPLEDPWLSKYLNVVQKYVRPFLGSLPESLDLDTPVQCIGFREQLVEQQTMLVSEIMGILPRKEALEEWARNSAKTKRKQLKEQIEELGETRLGVEAQLRDHTAELYKWKQPSFTECFIREAKRARISSATRSIREGAKAYAGSWLRPDIVIEMIKALSTP